MLGSAVAIIGSLAVAWLYIRNENQKASRTRVYERIQETFFEKGLLPVESALAAYGFATAFAVMDARVSIARCFIMKEESTEVMEQNLGRIAERPLVADLISKNFKLSMTAIPNIQRFGNELYDAMGKTFQFYSSILEQVLDSRVVKRNAGRDSDEFVRSLGSVAIFANLTQTYLGRRLTNARDYLWNKEFESYTEFLSLFADEKYRLFLGSLSKYSDYLGKIQDALKSDRGDERARISMEFSKWLNDNMDNNPLK